MSKHNSHKITESIHLSCKGQSLEKTVNKRQTTKIMNFKWRRGQRQPRLVNAPPTILESLECALSKIPIWRWQFTFVCIVEIEFFGDYRWIFTV